MRPFKKNKYKFKICSGCIIKSICSEDCDDAILDACDPENIKKLSDGELVRLGNYINISGAGMTYEGEVFSGEWEEWYDGRYGAVHWELRKRGYDIGKDGGGFPGQGYHLPARDIYYRREKNI
jgi:hypothetical protein